MGSSHLTIAHATEMGPDDAVAFEHGVALARATGGRLYSVNASGASAEGPSLPDAAEVLARWGDDQASIDHEAVVHGCCDDVVDTLLDALRRIGPDLVIAGTHQRSGFDRMLGGSAAEALAGNSPRPTLIFPQGTAGFVAGNGAISLRRIVVPAGDGEAANRGLERALWLGQMVGAEQLEIVLLHVGDASDPLPLPMIERDGWSVTRRDASGSVEDAIIGAAEQACVVVMATRGHDSAGDALFGSHTDKVLRRVSCPMLVVRVDEQQAA
jgi:nucleotide-binding universal stress UspA family protein